MVDGLRRLPADARDRLTGRRRPPIPPTRLMFDGTRTVEAFVQDGEEYLRYYVELAGLRPDDRILDLGSGIGRKTVPLTGYLSASGSYEGLDIVERGVRWCRKHITSSHPNFRFQRADVYNELYNPRGRVAPAEYRFPFADAEFDVVMLSSVFTHMLPGDVRHYLGEIARVLRPGGRAMVSWFLIDDESRGLIEAGRSTIPFAPGADCWIGNPDVAEGAVAYEERDVLAMCGSQGLELRTPIHYGSWCGRDEHLSYQDLVITVRTTDRQALESSR